MQDDAQVPGGAGVWGHPRKWGRTLTWGGDRPAFISEDALCQLTISATYPTDPAVHVWTGIGDLLLGGITYTGVGPEVVKVQIGQATEKEDARVQVTLTGLDTAEVRRAFYEFRGRVVVTVRLVYSEDGGTTWLEVPRFFRGLYSRPRITSNLVSFEVATYREEMDRGYETSWSNANQTAEYAGDRFFEHLIPIAEGADLAIRWPP